MKLSENDSIGHYRVLGTIGAGAMGAVYRVWDSRFEVERALKLVKLPPLATTAEHDQYRLRFFREARTLASLHVPLAHPNIVQVHDMGELDGIPWFTMQSFPGISLTEWVGTRPALDRVLHVVRQLASGLAHAHHRGVKHRDIKLGNALVSESERDHAVLIDFGIAKADHHEQLTMTGAMSGTETYMAPEYLRDAYRGIGQHTEQTDLWAFGVVCYALVTGRRPFDASQANYKTRIMGGQFVPILEARCDLDDDFAQVVTDLLKIKPAERIKSADVLLERLQHIKRTIDPAKPPFSHPVSAHGSAVNTSQRAQNFRLVKAEPSRATPAIGLPGEDTVRANKARQVPVEVSSHDDDDPFAAAAPALEPSLSQVAAHALPIDGIDDLSEGLFGTAMPQTRPSAHPGSSSSASSVPQTTGSVVSTPEAQLQRDGSTFLGAIDADVLAHQAGASIASGGTASLSQAQSQVPQEAEPSVIHMPPASFGPAVHIASNKASTQARRTFVLVAISVASVVGLGIAFNTISFESVAAAPSAYVDPATAKRTQDAHQALAEIEKEKKEQKERTAEVAVALADQQRRQAIEQLPPAPLEEAAPASKHAGEQRGGVALTRPAPTTPAPAPQPVGRYGARTSGNTSSITEASATKGSGPMTAAVKGIRIPARLKASATSAQGPIIAIVTQDTQVGTLRVPAGTEVHGTSAGTSGPRLNITFDNAIIGGRNIALRGSAFGADQRGGLAGARSMGNGSEAGSKAAAALVAGVGTAAAGAVGLAPVADAMRVSSETAKDRTGRLNNEEDLVTVSASTRFFIYVENLQQ